MASIANCTPANIVPGLRKHSGQPEILRHTVKFIILFVQMRSDELKCATKFLKNIRKGRKTLKTQNEFTTLGSLVISKLFVCYNSYIL